MIEDIVQYVMNGFLWLLLSKDGQQWLPFIMFISFAWAASLGLWAFLNRDKE